MADPADVFDNNSTPPSSDPVDLLASVKNEAGEAKYKTIEDAITALAHSQAFIPQLLSEKKTLEDEVVQLREAAKRVQSIEEVLGKLRANDEDQNREATPPAGSLSEEAVVNLVRKVLSDTQTESVVKTNRAAVQKALTDKFGEKVLEVVAKKAAEVNSTPEKLGKLAETDPNLVLALFQSSGVKSVPPTTSDIRLPSSTPVAPLEPPKKSLLLGATSREQKDFMAKVKEEVYRKYDVTT
jgi:hypothetical protein